MVSLFYDMQNLHKPTKKTILRLSFHTIKIWKTFKNRNDESLYSLLNKEKNPTKLLLLHKKMNHQIKKFSICRYRVCLESTIISLTNEWSLKALQWGFREGLARSGANWQGQGINGVSAQAPPDLPFSYPWHPLSIRFISLSSCPQTPCDCPPKLQGIPFATEQWSSAFGEHTKMKMKTKEKQAIADVSGASYFFNIY